MGKEMNIDSVKKTTFEKISEFITLFYSTEIPMIFLSLIVFVSWFFEIEIVAFVIMIVYASISLIFVDDTIQIIPVIILTTFTVADGLNIAKYINFAYAAIVIVGALIFHMIKYRKKLRFGKMFVPQALITMVLILGGVFNISSEHYIGTLPLNLLLGIGILLMYFLFYIYRNTSSTVDSRKYFAKMLSCAGAIVSLQIITYLVRSGFDFYALAFEFMDLGWGIDNNAAMILLISAPFTLYIATRKDTLRPGLYVIMGAVQYLAILLTFSRGGIIFGFISAIAAIIILIKKTEKKRKIFMAGGTIIIIALALFIYKFNNVINLLNRLMFQETGDNGRFDLYKEAWQCFIAHPIFGVGLGYQGSNYEIRSIAFYFFHSTFFQIIASTGLIGFFAFVYFYFRRYEILIKSLKKSVFAIFSLIAMLGFEAYSMIDTGTFIPFPFMMLIMFLTMILEEDLSTTAPFNDKIIDNLIAKKKVKPVDYL